MRFLLLILVLCAACNTHIYSPPAGTVPVESPAVVGAGRRSAGGDVALASAIFGPSVAGVRATYRHGLSEQLELSAAPSAVFIMEAGRGDSHGGIYGLRGGLKYAPIRHVSGTVGLGAGASAAGGFLSPDFGLNLGWENRYLVPFAGARMFLSAPIAPRYVHFTTSDDADDGVNDRDGDPDYHRRRPHFSYGFQVSTGLRVPFYWNAEVRYRPSLICAVGGIFLFDTTQEREGFLGGACGFEIGF